MVAQPPGNVFMLPDMLEDWRFETCPYMEHGGLRAYAGAPLRLQNETGDTVCLGSICVASPTRQEPLTRAQQTTLARLADWVVADIVQVTRARRQRERRRMVDLLAAVQKETDNVVSEEPVMKILQVTYPGAVVSLQTCKAGHVELKGRDPVPLSHFCNNLWEDVDHIDEFIAKSNHLQPSTDRVVRAIAVPCESVSGHSFLAVGSSEFQHIFDDIDAWFVQTCAGIISQMWQKRLLAEVMVAKEKFLRGFSHQLRTPVHGILGSVELLAEDLKSRKIKETVSKAAALLPHTSASNADDDHGVYLDTIKRAGRDLISIINGMITLNRWADIAITDRQDATYTLFEFESELANEVQHMVSGDARYEASVFFNHNIPPDHCSLRTDLGLLRDSLLPIIINAIQNTTQGLVVITISARPDSKELVVDIKDTGHGIAPKDHQRIFELYEQVDIYSTGAGLGLTLASRFAALLKGSIELVSSEIGHGSHFRATFQDMIFEHSDSPVGVESAISWPANIPQRFHVVPSDSNASSLSHHFAMSLTCYGFTASDDPEDVLIILDFVASPEQHRAAIAKIPSDRAVFCLVPSQEGKVGLDNMQTNVIYINGPFDTRAMRSALKRAVEISSLLNVDQVDTSQKARNPVLLPKLTPSTKIYGVKPESITSVGSKASDGFVKLLNWNQDTVPVDREDLALKGSKTAQSDGIERDFHLESPELGRKQLPVPMLEGSLVAFSSETPIESAEGARAQSKQHQDCWVIPNPTDPASTRCPTTLLVDDNAINLRVMQMYCKKRNLPCLCARDGLEAISIFQSFQESAAVEKKALPIQLILMDLQMPICDGIEATRRIRQLEREKNWGRSVIFTVTGQDSKSDRHAAKEAGSQEYYVKPLGMQSLDIGLKQYFPSFRGTDL